MVYELGEKQKNISIHNVKTLLRPRKIRSFIYSLIILLFVYIIYSNLQKTNRNANNYHLVSNLNYHDSNGQNVFRINKEFLELKDSVQGPVKITEDINNPKIFDKIEGFYYSSGGTKTDNIALNDTIKPKSNHLKPFEYFPVKNIIPIPNGKNNNKNINSENDNINNEEFFKIQADNFPLETEKEKEIRLSRLEKIKETFLHAWHSYKKFAWLHDELTPISQSFKDPFTGWAATLVDSLDMLYILDLKDEFEEAVKAINQIDFTVANRDEIPVFETVIRYLGGLISAYDVSGGNDKRLYNKAVELGELLYGIFDTPNRMPLNYFLWDFSPEDKEELKRKKAINDAGKNGYVDFGEYGHFPPLVREHNKGRHRAPSQAVIAEITSLTVEFTRLAQITGNDKYFDAVHRITEAFIDIAPDTDIPYLFPVYIDVSGCKNIGYAYRTSPTEKWDLSSVDKTQPDSFFVKNSEHMLTQCLPQKPVEYPRDQDRRYTIGGMVDSMYEYFPKEFQLLGGGSGPAQEYREFYEGAVTSINKNLLFRPLLLGEPDVIWPAGLVFHQDNTVSKTLENSHLSCFLGGMYALGGKLFNRPQDLDIAGKLTDGCLWIANHTATGLMPEMVVVPQACDLDDNLEVVDKSKCVYHDSDEKPEYEVGPGRSTNPNYYSYMSPQYHLRPEVIESVFYMYRTTGDRSWQDRGWELFSAIEKYTRTEIAYAAVLDVFNEDTQLDDTMESYFLAETLKYCYLLFSDPDVISLDDYVFNTEAHPFRVTKGTAYGGLLRR